MDPLYEPITWYNPLHAGWINNAMNSSLTILCLWCLKTLLSIIADFVPCERLIERVHLIKIYNLLLYHNSLARCPLIFLLVCLPFKIIIASIQVFSSLSCISTCNRIYFGHTVIFPVGKKTFQYLASTRYVYWEMIYRFIFCNSQSICNNCGTLRKEWWPGIRVQSAQTLLRLFFWVAGGGGWGF